MIEGVKKICYSFDEVIVMAKPNLAGKLKNLARDLKDEEKNSDVKKDASKSEVRKKQKAEIKKHSQKFEGASSFSDKFSCLHKVELSRLSRGCHKFFCRRQFLRAA